MRILKKRKPCQTREKWPITIYYDDREKKNRWHIDCPKFTMVKKRLITGDYTFKGYEDRFCIERKAHLTEFVSNLSGKKKHKFKEFLTRMSDFECACIIVEEDLSSLPQVLKDNKHGQLEPKDVYFQIGKIMFEYQIPILFNRRLGPARQDFLYYIFDSALQALKG